MSGGIAELFIELGVVGDTKKLDESIKKIQKAIKENEKLLRIKQTEWEFDKKIEAATSEQEKASLKEQKALALKNIELGEEVEHHKEAAAALKNKASAAGEVVGKIAQIGKAFLGVIASITGVVYAMNRMTDALTTNNQAWINLTRQTNLALETLQGYAAVANILDKTLGMQGAAQGMADLEQRLYEMQLTGQGADGFLLAGINPFGKDAEDVLESLRDRVQGLNNNQATFLLKKMGLDPRLLPMLRMHREEFRALNAEMQKFQLTEEQRESIQQFQMQLGIASQKIQYYKDKIAMSFLPIMVKLTNAFVKIAKVVSNVAEKVTEVIDNVLDSSEPVAQTVKAITLGIFGLIGAIGALTAAIWAFTAHPIVAAITLILGLIMAVVAAMWLVADDIIGWSQGKESVFGDILGIIDKIVEDVRVPEWVRKLWDIVSHIGELKDLLNTDKPRTRKENIEHAKNTALLGAGMNLISPLAIDPISIMLLGKATKHLHNGLSGESVTNNNIHQENYIYTSETGQAAEDALKQCQLRTAY